MQSRQALRGVKERNYIRQWLGESILALAIFLLGFCLVPTLISEASATQDVSAFASWSPVSLTLDPDYGSQDTTSARGDVVFGSITPTSRDTSSGSYGTQRVIKKTIGITSNGTYYTVFLSTSGSDNSLALDMENTDLSIPAIGNGSTTGVWSNPVAFSASGWGFSVPGNVIPASADSVGTSASATPPAFTNVVTGANLGKDLTKALDSSIYNQDIWSAVPSSSTPQQIWKATSTSANGFGTYTNSNNVEVTGDIVNDHFDIYYGIMVDTDVLSGTYENEIVYTALASATSLDDVSTNLSRETYIIANGTEQTLHFDLSSSIANPSSIINKDNITIYLVPHSTVATANYELTSAIKSNAANYTTCTIASNDDIELTDNGATLTCTSPDNTPADGTGLGEFDYWLHIDGYNFDYLSHYKKNEQDTATVAYIGLQSKLTDSNNQLVITEMQEMTGSVCRNTNMWGSLMNTETRDDARIYDYLGEGIVTIDSETGVITSTNTPLANTSVASEAVGLGTFVLADTRETVASGGMAINGTNYKTYLVRRYADGNCWMAQNLDLNLAKFVGTQNLTPENTDLAGSGRAYWDPGKSAYDIAYAIDNTVTTAQTSYFPVFATNRLGNAQDMQYQTNTVFGTNSTTGLTYYWGTKCSAAGACDSDATVANTALSSIPRAYNNDSENASGQPTAIYYTGGTGATQYGTKTGTNNSNTSYGNPGLYHKVTTWSPETPNSDDDTIMLGTRYFGDYYNWYAATAETGSYDTPTKTAVTDSICPKGWKLPANGASTNTSWGNLITTNSRYVTSTTTDDVITYALTAPASDGPTSTSMRLLPLSIPFTGYYAWQAASLHGRGEDGLFWSSTSHSSNQTNAWRLHFQGNFVSPQNNRDKVGGFTIRCVARD